MHLNVIKASAETAFWCQEWPLNSDLFSKLGAKDNNVAEAKFPVIKVIKFYQAFKLINFAICDN